LHWLSHQFLTTECQKLLCPIVGQSLSYSVAHSLNSRLLRHSASLAQSSMLLHTVKAGSASFASAVQAYARKLGQCLLELATSTDTSGAEAEMQSCTMETHALNLCVAMGNPRSFSKFHSQRLDGLSGADNSHLSDTFYVEMLVWCSLKTASCAAGSAYTCPMHHNPIKIIWCCKHAVDAKQSCPCQQSQIMSLNALHGMQNQKVALQHLSFCILSKAFLDC